MTRTNKPEHCPLCRKDLNGTAVIFEDPIVGCEYPVHAECRADVRKVAEFTASISDYFYVRMMRTSLTSSIRALQSGRWYVKQTERRSIMTKTDKWYVEKTPCFPKSWKVRTARNPDNSWVNYFATQKEAQDEADRRNETAAKTPCVMPDGK